VGFADVDGSKAIKRAELAKQYESENLQVLPTNNIGNQIDSSSKQNKDLKSVSNDSPPPVIINNTTSTQQTPGTPIKKQTGDDRSAYQKKTQG
jgi:hypothetical protein